MEINIKSEKKEMEFWRLETVLDLSVGSKMIDFFFSPLRLLMATSRLYGKFFMTCVEEMYLRYSMGGKTQGLIPVSVPSPYRRVDRKVRFALFLLV